MDILEEAGNAIGRIRIEKPLVHQITNYVTANDCANITLAIGALPVMADDVQEVEEITQNAKALVLNMGTLNQGRLEAMLTAGKTANNFGIPVVLDPVGVGSSSFRLIAAKELLRQIDIQILRGNCAEIKVLHGLKAACMGVDSMEQHSTMEIAQIASELARRLEATIVVTGKTDIVTDGTRVAAISNGTDMMAGVTGMGCMCSAMIGAFSAVYKDAYTAATSGVLAAGIAGELAYSKVVKYGEGPGSFRVRFIDEVHALNPDIFSEKASIQELEIY